jgi:tetratricopeptide (TPR) repeat protein
MCFIYEQLRQYLQAREMLQRRQELESLLTDRSELYDLYYSLGRVYERISDYPTALMWAGRAWHIAQIIESPVMMLNSLVSRMRAWQQWNRWDEAKKVAEEILQLIDKYKQNEKHQFWAMETLSIIAYHRGKQEEGERYEKRLKRLLDQQAERSSQEGRPAITTSLHAIHHAHEDWKQATIDYEAKLRDSEPFPSPELLATLAELLVMKDEEEEDRQQREQYQAEICRRAVMAGEQSGARKSLAIAYRAQGRMYMQQKQWDLAESDLRQALKQCEMLDLAWEKGHTLYYLGQFYQQRAQAYTEDAARYQADLSRACYNFEQAHGFYASLGAIPAQHKVQQALQKMPKPAKFV